LCARTLQTAPPATPWRGSCCTRSPAQRKRRHGARTARAARARPTAQLTRRALCHSASEHCATLLAALAAGCPPRDALPLFLEALQLSSERDGDADDEEDDDAPPLRLRFRAALSRGICALLARAPRRRWEAALNAAPQMLRTASAAASAAAACGDDPDDDPSDAAEAEEARAAATEALEAAVTFATAAVCAADAAPDAAAVAPALLRLLLRLLAAAATRMPRGAADARLATLLDALCARGAATSWAALDAAAAPLPAAAIASGSGSDAEEPDGADDLEARDAALGAAMLAAALLSPGGCAGGDALRGTDALPRAAPHATALLSGAGGPVAMHAGASLAFAAASATLAAGGQCSAAALQPLLAALAAALARAAAPATREAAHAALLRCLDALPPWARLDALRALLASGRDPAAAALLFRRIKDDARADWPRPPMGAAPAARLVADWLATAAQDCDDAEALAEAADATVGALNALRFALLRDAAGRSNASGLAAGDAAAELRTRTLLPLHAAAAAAAAALAGEQHAGAMLAAQTVQEVCDCVMEAADAAAAACADAHEDAAQPAAPGLRRGFLR
jgi:hypothetical protein